MHTCYISYNSVDDIGYVGYELGSGDYYYYGSSDQPLFLHDKRNGKLKKHILAHFEDEFTARNAETYTIKKLREGGMNLYNRNEGGGGKDGPLGDFRNLTNEFREIIDSIVIERKFPKAKKMTDARQISDEIHERLDAGHYDTFEEYLSVLSKIRYVQVREIRHSQDHIRKLYDSMIYDPVLFKTKTDPLIVVVDDRDPNNIDRFVIGGNHRIAASTMAGWETFPTVYINYSEFEYSLHNVKVFGVRDNTENDILDKPIEENDIKRLIAEFRTTFPDLDVTSYEFKEAFSRTYVGGQITPKRIAINLTNYIKKHKEDQLASESNFHQYNDKELNAIKDYISSHKKFVDAHILSDQISSLPYNGIGGIFNMLGNGEYVSKLFNKSKPPKKVGVIFARLSKVADVSNKESYINQFVHSMAIAGFETTDNSIWNNHKYTVKLIVLPWEHESDNSPVTWTSFKEAIDHCLRNEREKIAA